MSGLDIQDVTATGGAVDYTAPGVITATFAAGDKFVDMTFTIVADDDNEGVESFTVELQTPVGGVIAQPSVSTVFILEESGKYFIVQIDHQINGEMQYRGRSYLNFKPSLVPSKIAIAFQ